MLFRSEPLEEWTRLPGDTSKFADNKVFFMLNVRLAPGQRPDDLIFRPFFETVDGEALPTSATWHKTAHIPLDRLDTQSQYVLVSHSQILDSRVRFTVTRNKTLEKQTFTGGTSDLFAPDRQLVSVVEDPFTLVVTIPRFAAARVMQESHSVSVAFDLLLDDSFAREGQVFAVNEAAEPNSSALSRYTPVHSNVRVECGGALLPMDTKKVEIVLNSRLFERVRMMLIYTNAQIQTGTGVLPSSIELLEDGKLKLVVEPPESYMPRADVEGISWSLRLSFNPFDGKMTAASAVDEIYSMRVTGGDGAVTDFVESGAGVFGDR